MFDLTIIKKEIKQNPLCYVYKISKNKYKLIMKTDGKNEAKEKIEGKYKTGYFIITKIVFHTGIKFGQKGPISVVFNAYGFIDNSLKLKNLSQTQIHEPYQKEIRDNMIGPVWFDKTFLEKKGWNYNYINNIVEKLVIGNKSIKPLNTYHVHFEK